MKLLEHGGKIREAAIQYSIPLEDWIDLSTGINPNGWTIPQISSQTWARLPEQEDGLIEAAQRYYDTSSILPVAGSQAAIQVLPQLRETSRVGILSPSYNEHAHAWEKAGHELVELDENNLLDLIPHVEVLLLVNPNNPSGCCFSVEQLLKWHKQLVKRRGWLILDEAFIDATPELSLASLSPLSGLIILRSLGKFFGLAGARVGFVLAEKILLDSLSEILGPWTVSGPSREIARLALSDFAWHEKNQLLLNKRGRRLAKLLKAYGLPSNGGSSLFQWVLTDQAVDLHNQLAEQGIFTRLFTRPYSIRFGLPATEPQWQRFEESLGLLIRQPSLCTKDGARSS